MLDHPGQDGGILFLREAAAVEYDSQLGVNLHWQPSVAVLHATQQPKSCQLPLQHEIFVPIIESTVSVCCKQFLHQGFFVQPSLSKESLKPFLNCSLVLLVQLSLLHCSTLLHIFNLDIAFITRTKMTFR